MISCCHRINFLSNLSLPVMLFKLAAHIKRILLHSFQRIPELLSRLQLNLNKFTLSVEIQSGNLYNQWKARINWPFFGSEPCEVVPQSV